MTENERIQLRFSTIKTMTDQCGIEIENVEFISGGKTNESYVVCSKNGDKYLARIAGEGTEAFIDRKKEMHNVAVANQIGVAPQLMCTSGNHLLLKYIEGDCSTDQQILFKDNNLNKLTKQLCMLHESKEAFAGKFSFIHDFHTYKNDFLTTGYPIPSEMRKHEEDLYAMMKWVDESLSNDVCPVHSDIVLQNFIFTRERTYIVDWEYSTMADRYLDLASFCTQNILGIGVEEMFLKSYFSQLKEVFNYEKFLLFKMSISFMWVYWHLNNVAHNKDREYNEYRWRMHLNNALMCKHEWQKLRRSPSSL